MAFFYSQSNLCRRPPLVKIIYKAITEKPSQTFLVQNNTPNLIYNIFFLVDQTYFVFKFDISTKPCFTATNQ